MNLSCSCVPQRTRSWAYGSRQKRAISDSSELLLHEAHARMRRHLERAELDEAEPARRPVRRVELVDADLGAVRVAGDVDQQVAEQAVDEPRRRRLLRLIRLLERELELVQRVVPRFVDARRLARRADEHAREEIRQRRMVLPVGDQAAQQIGPPQERAVGRARAAEHDVVAAARARVPAVEHELLGHEPRVMRVLVETFGDREHLVPARRPAAR